jgi:hypothetical protein
MVVLTVHQLPAHQFSVSYDCYWRINDTTQVVLDHIQVHDNFENDLETKMNLSKNVQDERDAPWQVMLGSINPVFGVLISLGLWLERNLRSTPIAMASPYVFASSADALIPF